MWHETLHPFKEPRTVRVQVGNKSATWVAFATVNCPVTCNDGTQFRELPNYCPLRRAGKGQVIPEKTRLSQLRAGTCLGKIPDILPVAS